MALFKYVGGKKGEGPDVATIFGMECKKGEVVDITRPRQIAVLDANDGFERADGRTKAARAAKAKAEEAEE